MIRAKNYEKLSKLSKLRPKYNRYVFPDTVYIQPFRQDTGVWQTDRRTSWHGIALWIPVARWKTQVEH